MSASRRPTIYQKNSATPDRPASGLDLMIKSNVQRVQRAVLFTEQMCQALRKEFHAVWASESRGEQEAELVQRVEVLDGQARAGRELLLSLNGQSPPEQLKLLLGFDLKGMTASAQGLQGLATELRESREAEREAAPAEAAEPSGLMGKIMRWASTPAVTQRLGPLDKRGTRPLETPPDPHQQAKQAFESAFAQVSGILKYVGPRLLLIKVSFQTIGLPARRQAWADVAKKIPPAGAAAGVPREQAGWLARVAKACCEDDRAIQRGHMALVQWEEAQAMHQEATLLDMSLQTAPTEKVGSMLSSFNLGKFRAAVHQLNHLHISFRGIPTLQDLFPPPTQAPVAQPLGST